MMLSQVLLQACLAATTFGAAITAVSIKNTDDFITNAVISAPFPIQERSPAAATPPPGVDPDFTCAFVDPSKGLSTKVDCSYYYDKEHDRVKYKVDIHPTGQDSTRWCEQLIAALRYECPHGKASDRYVAKKCDTNAFGSKLGKGMSINFDAFSRFIKDDNAECTAKAIKATTCGIPAVFEKGGCYRSK
ncbi:hypothetical protein CkaCkLH20_10658 [Colletotrichum karsti]|uniref:Secreted protein n=1 Tax=Colletotrichum karsti TaxID=1095194 RepID=A0A9P6LDH3_9PEZI|nr:uncharacterized protein CkaCkLH20_10658 [Colletotrichum karsti]KAF9871724.1 hypothetical protein CkaCkLH20_10658 [Colletotrichum karsti]